ncbi:dihydropteroate synthase [Moorella sulfitireducens]|uniref:dihydropteroate synthase n=1 Tax=Neomoorella sulfitireducens TaxID=2972948 RepID=UPI0021AC4539
MLIVGEKINSSRLQARQILAGRDKEGLLHLAREQVAAGAAKLDVNAGALMDAEPEALKWAVETIQGVMDISLVLDSPNPAALAAALPAHRGQAMINSITLEPGRFKGIVPLVKEYGCQIVALCLDGRQIPATAAERMEIAEELVAKLQEEGIDKDNIYLDPLVHTVGTSEKAGVEFLATLRLIKERLPGIKTICGLSNISFGLPARRLVNRTFLVLAVAGGLDAAVLDPLDRELMAALTATELLLGRDRYCQRFLRQYKEGKLAN